MKKQARQLIISNLGYLLEHYPFDEITIKMLCAESQINRSTFYAHFKDKYETYEEIQSFHLSNFERLMDNIENSLIKHPNERHKYTKIYFINFYYYIYRYRNFFTSIIVNYPEKTFIKTFTKLLKERYKILFEKLKVLNDAKFFIDYTIGGQISMVYIWLKNECKETPEEMADVTFRNVIRSSR